MKYKNIFLGWQITHLQFVDLSILLGTEFCPRILGLGALKSFYLIRDFKNIETVLQKIDQQPPANFTFVEARNLFLFPDVIPGSEIHLTWGKLDVPGLIEFLCRQKGVPESVVTETLAELAQPR
jgi:flap endonuclease-1